MSHRILFILLTCITTLGMGSIAIAQDSLGSQRETILAQDSDSTNQPDNGEDTSEQQRASPTVQNLQSRLASLGYYSGPIDGIYGPATRRAVAEFQRASGLSDTGVIDQQTQQRLNNPATPNAFSVPNSEDDSNSSSSAPETNEEGSSSDALGNNSQSSSLPTPESSSTALEAPDSTAILTVPGDGVTPGETDLTSPSQTEADSGADSLLNENLNIEEPETVANTDQGNEDPAADSETYDEPRQNRGLFRLAVVGLAILILGGLGGAVLLLLARRNTLTLVDVKEDQPEATETEVSVRQPERVVPSSITRPTQDNNANVISSSISPGHTDTNHRALSTTPSSTPRLAKVNIIDELIQDLESLDPGIRRKSIWELGQRGNSAAVQPLIGLMVNADSHEQSLILAALSEIGMRTLKPMNRALALSLQDENPEVRKNAIRDLARIYDSMGQVGRMLGHATSDDDPDVRKAAHWAIDQLNNIRLSATESAGLLPEGTPSVERLPLKDDNPSLESLPEEESSSHTA
ncbi:MAG: hypothetical protein F6K42_14795 [Leptolyngbya sp. SIO1D8]|nr:hypothetical protein [Leptolyngbya sp. SIO1D8]